MHRAIIFDYDDTLVQTRKCRFKAIKHLALADYGVALTDETIEKHWGKEISEFFRCLLPEQSDNVQKVLQRYHALNPAFPMEPFPESLAVVEALAKQYFLGIVTAASRDLVMDQLRSMEFPLDAMRYLQFADDSQHHKPDPRVFDNLRPALAAAGIEACDVMYVGDGVHDYRAAADAGFQFVGIARDVKSQHRFSELNVPFVTDLGQLN